MVSVQALARSRIRHGFQQIERNLRTGQILLIVDDEVGAVFGSADVRWFFSDLIEHTRHLHFLILSREPIYDSLGSTKIVNVQLAGLNEMDSARLFMQRIHRVLEPRDLHPLEDAASEPNQALRGQRPVDRVQALSHLRGHPLMRRLKGHPGNICIASSHVIPQGQSLYKLASSDDLLEPGESQQGRSHRSELPGPFPIFSNPLDDIDALEDLR